MQRQASRQRGTENTSMNSSAKKGQASTRRSIFDFPEPKEPQRIRRVKARRKMIQNYRNTIREIYHQTDYLVDWKDEDLSCFITPIEKTSNAAMMGKSCHSDNYSRTSESYKNEVLGNEISELDVESSTNPNIEFAEKSTQLSDQGVSPQEYYSEKESNDLPQELVFENTQTCDNSNEEEITYQEKGEEEKDEEIEENNQDVEEEIIEENDDGIEENDDVIEENDDGIKENDDVIEENDDGIKENDDDIEENDDDIEDEEEEKQEGIETFDNDIPNEETLEENDEEVFENETVEMTLLGVGDLPNDNPQDVFVTIQHYACEKPIGPQYKTDNVFSDDPQSYIFHNVNENEIIELLVWQNNAGTDPSLVSGIRLNVNSINWEETGSQFFDLVSADDLRAEIDTPRSNAGNIALVFNIFSKEQ